MPEGVCCVWCGVEVLGFRDKLSVKEFCISGLCQKCQDETFPGEEGSSAVNVLQRRSRLGPLVPVPQICPTCGKVDVFKSDGHDCGAEILRREPEGR